MSDVFRQERKFLITYSEFKNFSAFFDKLLRQDVHSSCEDGYLIRSLYFDSLYNKDYFEKEDGLEQRRKIRLRTYGSKSNFAVLEMKQKDGSNQRKRSIKLNREQANELILGNYEILLSINDDFAVECYYIMNKYCYRPKTIVQYKRKAYVVEENNIRITFDYDIKFSESDFNLFNENMILNEAFDSLKVILEIKYNNFLLDYIRDFINKIDKSEISVSKYCLARSYTLNYIF
jgi:hypothetical protein